MNRVADLMRAAYTAPTKDRPELLRAVAEALVELRSTITNNDGRPDWRGTSWEYRSYVSDALSQADVPYEERDRFMNSVRYHTSKVLHARLDAETIAEHGLRPDDSLRRSQLNRDERRAELSAARKAGFDKRKVGIKRRTATPVVVDKDALRARLLKMLAELDED